MPWREAEEAQAGEKAPAHGAVGRCPAVLKHLDSGLWWVWPVFGEVAAKVGFEAIFHDFCFVANVGYHGGSKNVQQPLEF